MPELSMTMAITNATYPNASIDSVTTTYTAGVRTDGPRIISVTTAEYTWTLPTNVASDAGLVYIRNTDVTNFIQIGYSAGVYLHKLPPASDCKFWVLTAATALYLLADTATCIVEIAAWERTP